MDIVNADIAVIGGSGLYSLVPDFEEYEMDTPYGKPSSKVAIGTIGNKSVAFIARHGARHVIPPHKVPYRANIAALKQLGVSRIIATSAVGSLKPDYKPGDLVLIDQFVNMTHGRDDTFFDGEPVVHISTAEPYCPELRGLFAEVAESQKVSMHKNGTVVVIQGPRFSTKAESKAFGRQGFDLVGMTQYPEVALAREQGMCYACVAIVTDYDAGLEGSPDIKPVSAGDVTRTFAENMGKVKKLLLETLPEVPDERSCTCKNALDGAVLTKQK